MTRDAFAKAKELDNKLHMVNMMRNIISNSTLGAGEDWDAPHNTHVINDEVILCYMCKADDFAYKKDSELDVKGVNGCVIKGDYHMGGNFVFGKDVPIDLVTALEHTLWEYETKIQKEFDRLKGTYENGDDD